MKLRWELIVRYAVIGGIVELSFHRFNDLKRGHMTSNHFFPRFFILVYITFLIIHGKLRCLISCIHYIKGLLWPNTRKEETDLHSKWFLYFKYSQLCQVHTYVTRYYLKLLWYSATFLSWTSLGPTCNRQVFGLYRFN